MPDKTTVSNARDYREIGEFWDAHDATEYGEEESVEFAIDIRSQRRYFVIDSSIDGQLYRKIRQIADQRGVSEGTFLNAIVQEKINQIEQAP
uniref:CopG antitoxin of type II toxin-antitoxin system n=1 Tax=Candidatus Kentrum sp. DK TaxID=2126562 RepID=A0A450TLL1_9GAMM|nr:MAG: CopG antitoxin of type II toxin-antitoxin system [Candidatus Kentron sp. DK]